MDITNSIVEIITQGAFYKCFSLSEIKIPKNVTQISNFAFFRCQSLLFITLACLDTKIEHLSFPYWSKIQYEK